MNRHNTNPQCQSADPYYYDYFSDSSEQIPTDIVEHITDCPNCQDEIQWLKQTISKSEESSPQNMPAVLHAAQMQLHCALIDQPARCSTIKPFLPILAIPEMAVRIDTPVTTHIKACVQCTQDLETLKQLDLPFEKLSCLSQIFSRKQSESSGTAEIVTDTFFQGTTASQASIRRIMDRPDSGVVTCFRAKDTSASPDEEPYHIEATKDEADSFIHTSTDRRQQQTRVAAPVLTRSRRLFRPVAAAAVLIIAILLFQNSSVKATDIGQIYEALKNVKNVMMTHYEVGNPDPIQQVWISRSLGIKLFETNSEFVLYDIKNKAQKIKADPASDVQQIDIDRITAESVAKTMEIPWGLLPFNNTSALPDGAVWKKVRPEEGTPISEQTEIYDLFWSVKNARSEGIDYQWRCHVDPVRKRPFKVEWWQKNRQTQEYELTTYNEIAYLTQDEIQGVIDQAGL